MSMYFCIWSPSQDRCMKAVTEWVRLQGNTVGHLVQPLRSSRTIPEHMVQDCLQTVLEFQWGRLHSLSGPSIQVHGHLHNSQALPHIQVELPVHQVLPTASCPVAWHHWTEPGSVLLTLSLQVLTDIDEIPLSDFSRLNRARRIP